MLANLSVSSILITISTISVYIQMTFPLNIYGPLYCKFYPGIHSKSLQQQLRFCRIKLMSVFDAGFMLAGQGFTMICISLERTQRVRFPLMMRVTKLSAMKKIGVIWFLALLSEMPRGLFYEYDPTMKALKKCSNVCTTVKLQCEIFGGI